MVTSGFTKMHPIRNPLYFKHTFQNLNPSPVNIIFVNKISENRVKSISELPPSGINEDKCDIIA